MATDSREPGTRTYPEHAKQPIGDKSQQNGIHQSASFNSNSTVNSVHGSVQTIINSNSISNYGVHGAVPKESDALQIKICAALKPRYVPQAVYDAQLGSGCMHGTRVKILRDIEIWVKDPRAQKIFWLTGWAGTGKSTIAWTICSLASRNTDIVLGGSFFCSRSAVVLSPCLRIMDELLHFNISENRSSYEPNSPAKLDHIPLSLEYACTQWVYHVASLPQPSNLDRIIDDIFRRQFMFWLEVMSVLGQVPRAAAMLFLAASTVQSQELSRFLRDANFFVASSHQAIEHSAAHIYLSALPFTSRHSLVYQTFFPLCTGLVFVELFRVQPHGGGLFMTLPGHGRRVTSLAYSPDGLLIVSGSDDGTVRIWDTRTGEETVSPLRGGCSVLRCVAIAPNGRNVVSGTDDGPICIWNVLSGPSIPQRFGGHSTMVTCVAYSSDSALVASASRDTTVRVRRAGTGETIAVHNGYIHLVSTLVVSPDGRITVCDSSDYRIAELREQGLRHDSAFQISPTGMSVVSVEGRSVCLWTQRDADEWSSIRLGGHTDAICSAIFSPNGLYIASASDDGTIRIWDAGGGQTTAQPAEPLGGRLKLGMSLTGANIVSVSDELVRVWSFGTGERHLPSMKGDDGGVLAVSISSNGAIIASASKDNTVQLWDAGTGNAIGQPLAHRWSTAALAFTQDARRLAAGSTEPIVRIWTAARGRSPAVGSLICSEDVSTIVFSLDGRFGAGGSSRGSVFIWQIETYQQIRTLPFSGSHNVHSISFSPDGSHIVFGGDGKVGRVWNVSTGDMVLPLVGHTGSVRSVTYHPDGQFIITGSNDRSIRLWDSETGLPVATTYGHRESVVSVGFAPDGESIVSASDDGSISVWDVSTEHVFIPKNGGNDLEEMAAATIQDGWLKGPSGELLFWVPAEYRPYLQVPPHIFRSDRRSVFVTPGSDGWHRGNSWTSCWRMDV